MANPYRRFWFFVDEGGKEWGPFDDAAKADLATPYGTWRELTPAERVEFGAPAETNNEMEVS